MITVKKTTRSGQNIPNRQFERAMWTLRRQAVRREQTNDSGRSNYNDADRADQNVTWFALTGQNESWFSPEIQRDRFGDTQRSGADPDALVLRGSIVIETRFPVLRRPRPLMYFQNSGDWPVHLSLQAVPGGSLTLVFDQGGEILHHAFNGTDAGRTDILRVTYSWDAPARTGRLVLERADKGVVQIVPVTSPGPIRLKDIEAIIKPGDHRYLAPEVIFVAASDAIEPVGPVPGLWPDTPIATPGGFRPARDLKRGDLVFNPDWDSVPVLHSISRTVPARGSFRPVRMCTPYFGLKQDIITSSLQGLIVGGSGVEYLFGKEAVRFQAGHLAGGRAVKNLPGARFTTYVQLVLPENEALNAAGAHVESLWIGRIRRNPNHLAASSLAGIDRNTLPEHAPPATPELDAFEAAILSEHRAA